MFVFCLATGLRVEVNPDHVAPVWRDVDAHELTR
jgi:hypothetical protein